MLQAILDKLAAAKEPEDLFGPLTGDMDAQLGQVRQHAHKLILTLHPDHNGGQYAAETQRVVTLRGEAEKHIRTGHYGQPRLPPVDAVLRSKESQYTISALLGHDSVADFYLAEAHGAVEGPTVCKVVRAPKNNDLLENEARVLGFLRKLDDDKSKTFRKYTPKLLESFLMHEAGGVRKRVTTFSHSRGWYSLADVKAHHGTIDPRDAAWMLNRMLEGLGWVHHCGYVHGAIHPPNILIRPGDHGGRIIGWTSAVRAGDPLVAVPKVFRRNYPEDALKRKGVTPALDLTLLAESFWPALADPPEPLYDFLMYGLDAAKDGWDAFRQLDVILRKLYGPKTFRPFSMPQRAAAAR